MAQIRFEGFQTGENLGTVSATVGVDSDSTTISSFRKPSAQSTHPTISDAFNTGTLTPDDNGISVTTRIWRNADTLSVLGSGATLSGSGLGGVWVEYSPDNGTTWSPPVQVYQTQMMASHAADDAAAMALVPHDEVTHFAVADGSWTNPATWNTGTVPKNGAFPLVTRGRTVTYDQEEPNIRLDRVRVDGTLNVTTAPNTDTKMLVETFLTTRGSVLTIGTASDNRMPASSSFTLTVSGKDYSADSFTPTDMKAANFTATRGWGRGVLTMGDVTIWGSEKTTWDFANAEVLAGATSLTLQKTPVGIEVGDEIIIGATTTNYTPGGEWGTQDEVRTLTEVSGATLSWTTPLVYDHGNPRPASTRTDVYPTVTVKRGKNVTFQSEVLEPVYRRGHCAFMHGYGTPRVWDAQAIGLGRTDKRNFSGTMEAGTGDFQYFNNVARVTEPLTPQSNLQSRYAWHFHHNGFTPAEGEMPTLNNCYAEESWGWLIVHHSCAAKLDNNAMYRFFGAGMVSESANELNSWDNNIAVHTTQVASQQHAGGYANATGVPKNMETPLGIYGDRGRWGYGFFFAGRAMVTNRNAAVSCAVGHMFFHRSLNNADNVAPTTDLNRNLVDVKALGISRGAASPITFSQLDYPIIHFDGNYAHACYKGGYVTKGGPQQNHDLNVKLKNFTAVGCNGGFEVEYVSTYIFENFDLIGSAPGGGGVIGPGFGISTGSNAWQITYLNCRAEGFGWSFANLDTSDWAIPSTPNNTTNPRYIWIGLESIAPETADYFKAKPKAFVGTWADLAIEDLDLDGTAIDYSAEPSDTIGLYLNATAWNGSNWGTVLVNNTAGGKTDSIGSDGHISQKFYNDWIWPSTDSGMSSWANLEGYWSYGGDNVVLWQDVISDRATGRPHVQTKMARLGSGTLTGRTNNGPLTYSTTPITQADQIITLAQNGSVTFNPTTGAAGGGGSIAVKTDLVIKPNHGELTIDGNSLTYEPFRGFVGEDQFYVFLESDGQFKTVLYVVQVGGSGSGLTTPLNTTHFTMAAGGSLHVNVTLLAPPDTDSRKIVRTEYSTDGEAWRKLCNFWVPAVHRLTTRSNGDAFTSGTVDVRIRYKCSDHRTISGPSAAVTVTVT